MILSMLSGCNNGNPEEPDNQEELQGDEVVDDGKIILVADGATDYVIVRGENASATDKASAFELQNYLKQISGVEIPVVSDSTEAVEKEIIVGKTNREEAAIIDREELGTDGFVIKTTDSKLSLFNIISAIFFPPYRVILRVKH